MKPIPVRHLAACFAFIALTSPLVAGADTGTSLPTLDVSASRTAADAARLPVGTVIIDRAQIERMSASNLAEVLRGVGGVTLSSLYGSGSYTKADMLGFGATAGQNTLLLLNGRRLNTTDLSSVNLDSIPVTAIERIEILPGSGSVLYGSGAVGGVINVVTRQHYGNAGRIEGTVGELDTRGGAVQGSFTQGQTDGMASVNRFLSDNYRDNNKLSQSRAFADLRHVNEGASFYLTTLYDHQDLGLPGALANTALQHPSAVMPGYDYDWGEDKTVNLMPGMRLQLADQLNLYLDTGFRERKQDAGYYAFGAYTTQSTDRTLNLSPRLAGENEWGVAHNWMLGLDYSRTRYNFDSQSGFGNAHDRNHRSIQAVYAQDSMGLTDSTWLTLGARHEWIRTAQEGNPGFLPHKDAEAAMWSAGLRQALSDKVSLFAKAERSVRYATFDELRDYAAGWTPLPLDTQSGKLYTLGANWQKDGQYSTLTVWRGKYHDEIATDPFGSNTNLDPTRREGVSLNSYWKLDKALWLALAGTYQEVKFDKGAWRGNWVPAVPRLTGSARLDWQLLESLSLSLAERYQGEQYLDNDQANNFGVKIPSYHWMDVSASFRPTGAKSVYVSATLHNAENRKGAYDYGVASAFVPGSYNAYPLPGRYLVVKAGVDF